MNCTICYYLAFILCLYISQNPKCTGVDATTMRVSQYVCSRFIKGFNACIQRQHPIMNGIFLFVLKASGNPSGQQGGAQSCSERELEGCGSITEVSAAAGPGGCRETRPGSLESAGSSDC